MKWLWIILGTLAVFTLFDAKTGWPHEWGEDEGRLKNMSSDVGLCLWDNLEGKLCGAWVDSGKWCRGDAMLVSNFIFKVPNRTTWICDDLRCEAADMYSYLRFEAAKIKNGGDRYGEMSMDHFKELMWDWSIDLCRN